MPRGTASARRRINACERGPGTGVRRRMVGISVVPADRLLVEVDVDLLGLQIFFDAPRSQLASKPGLLIASPRRLDICGLHMVHPDYAGAQRLHRAHGFKDVTRP